MAAQFSEEPNSEIEHFFITSDPTDHEVVEEVSALDLAVAEPTSITRFLILPTITRQKYTRIRDPIFYFAQPKILTSD
jgi:hypothetical protein